MTPYYSDDHVTIYHARCEEVLPILSNVGLVLTSPPYNLRGDGNSPSAAAFSNLRHGYDTHDDAMPHAEYVAWQHSVLRLCWATLADDGAIYYQHKPRVGGNVAKLPTSLIVDPFMGISVARRSGATSPRRIARSPPGACRKRFSTSGVPRDAR